MTIYDFNEYVNGVDVKDKDYIERQNEWLSKQFKEDGVSHQKLKYLLFTSSKFSYKNDDKFDDFAKSVHTQLTKKDTLEFTCDRIKRHVIVDIAVNAHKMHDLFNFYEKDYDSKINVIKSDFKNNKAKINPFSSFNILTSTFITVLSAFNFYFLSNIARGIPIKAGMTTHMKIITCAGTILGLLLSYLNYSYNSVVANKKLPELQKQREELDYAYSQRTIDLTTEKMFPAKH